jgi:hypothetical protein
METSLKLWDTPLDALIPKLFKFTAIGPVVRSAQIVLLLYDRSLLGIANHHINQLDAQPLNLLLTCEYENSSPVIENMISPVVMTAN